MTKIKTTKKGMAKKTLSMSLVLAMLATSNVPVWAADFSDGTDAAVEAEAPAVDATEEFSDDATDVAVQATEAEAPVVEENTNVDVATADMTGVEININDSKTVSKKDVGNVAVSIGQDTANGLINNGDWPNSWKADKVETRRRVKIEWGVDSTKATSYLYKNATSVSIPDLIKSRATIGKTVTVTAYIETISSTQSGYGNNVRYTWGNSITTSIKSTDFKVIGDGVADYVIAPVIIAAGKTELAVDAINGQDVSITLPSVKTGLTATIEKTTLLVDGEESDTDFSKGTILVEAGHTYQLKSHIVAEDGALKGDIESNVLTVTASEVSSLGAKVIWKEIGTGKVDDNNKLSYTYKKGDSYVPTISKIKIGENTYTTDNFSISYENNTTAGTAGEAKVVVTFVDGDLEGQVLKVPFTINPADLSKATVALGSTYVYAPTDLQEESLKNANLTVTLDGVTLKAVSSNETDAEKIAAADVVYTLTASQAGQNKGTITIEAKTGDVNYNSAKKTLKFDVAQKDLSTAYVINPSDRNYTGAYIDPKMNGNENEGGVYYTKSTETAGAGVGVLTKDTDFVVDWNGTNFNKGTATATITGIGNYTGTTTATFKIDSAKETDFDKLKNEIAKDLNNRGIRKDRDGVYHFTYTGKEQDFILQAYGLNWTLGSQYTYSYQGQHTNVGAFTVKVVGQNSYEGNSFTLKCYIDAKSVADFKQKSATNTTGEITVADLEYVGEDTSKYVPSASVVWNGMTLKEGIDFKIVDSKVDISGKKVTFKIEGLGNYRDKTSETLTATILGKNINSSSITVAPIENQTYTGNAISMKGKLVIKDGEKTLAEGTDYHIVTEKNNTKPGVATVTIAGHGNYSGEKDITFLIVDKEYNAVILNEKGGIELEAVEYDYNKANSAKGIELAAGKFQVKDAKGETIPSNQYTVTYENNHAAGTATIKVTGREGYNFSAISTFVIKPKQLKAVSGTYSLKDDSAIYTGEEIKPEYTVKLTDGLYTLVEGTDYEVKYSNNVDASEGVSNDADKPSVTITGLGNYAGLSEEGKLEPARTLNFTIYKATITPSEVTANDVEYAGGFEVSDITVKNPVSGKVLTAGTDYTVTLKDATKVGAAEATIKLTTAGAKNYKFNSGDSLTVRYSITAKDLKNVTVSAIADQTATGEQIKPEVTVMNGNIKLTEGTDYEVVYGDNKEVGEGTVTVKALDSNKNYTGSQTVKFNIVENKTDVGTPEIASAAANGNKAVVTLAGEVKNATAYDYVISADNDLSDEEYVAELDGQVATEVTFAQLEQGSYYAFCRAWTRDENGKKVYGEWSEGKEFKVTAVTPETPEITEVSSYEKNGSYYVTVTYTASANAEKYGIILGTKQGKDSDGQIRPLNYGTMKKNNVNADKTTVTFKVPKKGTYYAGLRAYNKSGENGKKVYSNWSNVEPVSVPEKPEEE